MTTILLILIGVLLFLVLVIVAVVGAAFMLIHRLERFLKGHKNVTSTLATVTTLAGMLIGLRETFSTKTKK